ncbi:hypothetical protein QJS10_CPA05g01090 [Acorus calamus]|uniref:PB1 domain-containing protein n=1 Tax=Acorus calamus TaxID=4465 RepID=A0AAV9EWA5_ACOCL|nr:hypothetical protein QJS10_CPA05g01090 [Acorus calamus]
MGKSGGRRKKTNPTTNPKPHHPPSPPDPQPSPSPTTIPGDIAAVFLKRAHELKESGNRLFQSRDYAAALHQYDLGLKLLPPSHPDRAVFHSNRAACLMLARPVVDYEAVASECSLALRAQPNHPRALLRRARALEARGRREAALQDALSLDPSNRDALDLARRLRSSIGDRASAPTNSRPSPAALGASAVRGTPTAVACLGPCLPARPVPKKPPSAHSTPAPPEKPIEPLKSVPEKPGNTYSSESVPTLKRPLEPVVTWWRPLKLVFDHDIRLARMPARCTFKELREVVTKRFPSAGSVLIKYKDSDGDLVTITSTAELRLAESCVDCVKNNGSVAEEQKKDLVMLRLHIVEVSPEQEPALVEEEEIEMGVKSEGVVYPPLMGESVVKGVVNNGVIAASEEEKPKKEEKAAVATTGGCNHAECKEAEIDDWLLDFAQLFRTHVGIDPDAHVDLHELGMELCSEAVEEAVTSEEAQTLFEMAACKFQEVAALAFFNWGNVHMCTARKKIPLDESSPEEVLSVQLQSAYDWVSERYALAGLKYEEALRIKPDFYEALLALGQQHFETAKLNCAEEKMSAATEMWEKVEEEKAIELKDPTKEELLLRRRKKQMAGSDGEVNLSDGQEEPTAEEVAKQNAAMRSQIHLFWGNMLFERSQVEFKLGVGDWKKRLDGAVERFKLAGASEADISVVLKNHASKGADVVSGEKMRVQLRSDSDKTDAKDD